ncbi:MAG: DUF4124 domain-containing protein [Panacagrimonas sp.]
MRILRVFGVSVVCLVFLVMALVATDAVAAVFRCTQDGHAHYSDRPCRAGDAPRALPRLGVAPAGPQADLASENDLRRERNRDARQRDDAAWLEAHAERKANERRMESAIRAKRTAPGMSADQVRRALGRPDSTKRDRKGGERWTYRDGKKKKTVRLKDGRVVGADPKAARRTGEPEE